MRAAIPRQGATKALVAELNKLAGIRDLGDQRKVIVLMS